MRRSLAAVASTVVIVLALVGVTLSVPAVLAAPTASSAHGAHGAHDAAPTKPRAAALHDAMHKLWEDHITWTRLYIVSAATLPDAALPDLSVTAERLLQNQADLGDAFRPFYGDAAGDAVTELLREHILVAAALIDAAKAGDGAEVEAQLDLWYDNADRIAAALNGLNPKHWPLEHLESMMRAHLDRTLEEAVARLQGRYADDVAAYEAIHADILEMADMLSDGIVAQFPNRFRG